MSKPLTPGKRGASPNRCGWARNPLAIRYHDREWGVPVRNDRKLFEFLLLEGAQAGLSWDTILAKRENYRKALDGFSDRCRARFSEAFLSVMAERLAMLGGRLVSLMQEQKVGLV